MKDKKVKIFWKDATMDRTLINIQLYSKITKDAYEEIYNKKEI